MEENKKLSNYISCDSLSKSKDDYNSDNYSNESILKNIRSIFFLRENF